MPFKAVRAHLLAGFVLLFLPLEGSAVAQQTEEPRLALIMGVGDYSGTRFPALPGIKSDLNNMEAALKSTGFTVTVVTNPTVSEAEEAIENFGTKLKTQTGGVGLFYFSGHGGEFEGRNYLIPRGARIGHVRDIKQQGVAAQRVLNRMEDAGARVSIVFLDCCRNDLTKAATDSGLAPMSAKGIFIGFATGADKSSLAGAEGSPYTYFLAKRLLTPGVSISDMHTQVTADVEDFTKANGVDEQTPFQYSGLRSNFYFVRGPTGGPPAPMTRLAPIPSNSSALRGQQPRAAAPAAPSEEKVIAEVTLETDLKVTGGPDVLSSIAEEQRESFASLRSWFAMAPDQSLAIGIGRLEMKPKVPIDLDGAIKGGIQQAVKKGGDEDPKFEVEVTKVSGLEGRKTTYAGSAPFRIESVVARDGQVVYQIQIFYAPARAADAQRILKSIKIAHAQP